MLFIRSLVRPTGYLIVAFLIAVLPSNVTSLAVLEASGLKRRKPLIPL